MLRAVRIKFLPHEVPRDLLLSTGEAQIFETAPLDTYWRCRPDGLGRNTLGKILMLVREELRSDAP